MRVRAALALGLAVILVPVVLPAVPRWARVAGAPRVFIRSGPSTQNAPLGVLREGHRLRVIDPGGTWWEVLTEDGIKGFVNEQFLTPEPSQPEGEEEQPAAAHQRRMAASEHTARLALAKEIAALSRQVKSLRRESRQLRDLVAASRTREANPGRRPTSLERILGVRHPLAQAVPLLAALLCGWILGALFHRRRGRRDRYRLRL